MLNIHCTTDIDTMAHKCAPVLIRAVREELDQLRKLLDFDGKGDGFRLDGRGYSIVCLEPQEAKASIFSLGLRYPYLNVEFVELLTIKGIPYYRIMLMHDNESFTSVFSLKGQQDSELEIWLALHAIEEEADPK